jgi:hypothetical protein
LKQFPGFTYPTLLNHGATVDVSWFNERALPDAFWEVENTTDFRRSLGKFVEFQDFRVGFRVVADASRRAEFEARVCESAFAPVRELVRFVDYAAVARMHDAAMESTAAAGQMEQV